MPPPPNLDAELHKASRGIENAWAAGWKAETATLAVAAHKRGYFISSWQLQLDAPSYPPIKAALKQRISAARSALYSVAGPIRAPGRFEVDAARKLWPALWRLSRSTFRDRTMMGISVWQHPIVVNPDTLRHEVSSIERWPIAAVEHTSSRFGGPEGYYAVALGGQRIPLPPPGTTDGHWTVVGEGDQPHLDGAIVALDISYVAGQRARRAFSKMIDTMGKASPIGELADGVTVASDDGKAFLEMVTALGTEHVAGVHAKGGKVYPFEVTSTTGNLLPQVTDEQARMVAWAILSHDATISRGEVYNDPRAQSVPEDLTREDVEAFCAAGSNLFAFLARLNAGDVEPPRLLGILPDSDQDERQKAADDRRAARATRTKSLFEVLALEKAAGIPTTQARVNELAEDLDVLPPTLPVAVVATVEGEPAPAPSSSGPVGDVLGFNAAIAAEKANGFIVDQMRVNLIAAQYGVIAPTLPDKAPAGGEIFAYHLTEKIVAPDQALERLGLPALPHGAGTPEQLALDRLAASRPPPPAPGAPPATAPAAPVVD